MLKEFIAYIAEPSRAQLARHSKRAQAAAIAMPSCTRHGHAGRGERAQAACPSSAKGQRPAQEVRRSPCVLVPDGGNASGLFGSSFWGPHE